MWWYSKTLKKKPLWGNLIVSLCCALVIWMIWIAEQSNINKIDINGSDSDLISRVWILHAYAVFAFISTLFREIVKDMEDVLGDQESGCRTLPIVYGVKTAKNWAGLFGILLIGSVFFWAYIRFKEQAFIEVGFLVLAIIIPAKVALLLLGKAGENLNSKV